MQQTSKYQFNLVDSTDDFSPAPLNQNMEKVEEELEGLEESLASVMETVDGHKLAVGSYQGNGGSQTINVGFTPAVVLIHNTRIGISNNSLSAIVTQSSAGFDVAGPTDVIYIVEGGFTVKQGANTNLNSDYYTYNYLAIR